MHADLLILPLQYPEGILQLQDEARRRGAQQVLGGAAKQLLDPLGDGAGAVAAEAAHRQLGQALMLAATVEIVAQGLHAGFLPLILGDQQLVPAVQGDQIDALNQVVTQAGVAKGVGMAADQVQVFLAAAGQRVQADIDQQQDAARLAGARQGDFGEGWQGQRKLLLQAVYHAAEFVLAERAFPRVQDKACGAVDQTVTVPPGEQLKQVEAAFERRMIA